MNQIILIKCFLLFCKQTKTFYLKSAQKHLRFNLKGCVYIYIKKEEKMSKI